ncbi:acyl carrier protein reductase [Bacillus phage SP-15]|uniref:Acyl carrier protein reductase n=1 Tax=Bacillus phage SP-15 TaxID=1792032 RepID=A0A127AWG8_9CAUD|nr:FabG-like 3-oxoacyl-(acyl-carrier-protein) reductase [Bacillus phage SP-15]AMM44927.1 acyl carrier protein reductase [Bacillus phage SP-15]
MGFKVIYGANSYIAKNVLHMSDSDYITVGNQDCDYTYEEFRKLKNIPGISQVLYATGRPQPPNSKLSENPDLFSKNAFDFFKLMEHLEEFLMKDASIVYLSSGHSVRASDINPYYAASKASVNSYVVSMSKKFAKMNLKDGGHRRINAVAPEAIDSPMIDSMLELDNVPRDVYINTRPNMRLLSIEEVVHPILFLLSNKSTGINGQILILGGVK